jgi:hypothetical protein
MSKVSQFVARYPTVPGYDLICFLEFYSRLVGASFDELITEGLESEATAQFYAAAIRRISQGK